MQILAMLQGDGSTTCMKKLPSLALLNVNFDSRCLLLFNNDKRRILMPYDTICSLTVYVIQIVYHSAKFLQEHSG